MELVPIRQTVEENLDFAVNPDCRDTLQMSLDYYKKIGYTPPWIGYYAQKEGQVVGSAGFKGAPRDGTVEIAYGTIERFRRQGIGTELCRELVKMSLKADPAIVITARTLPELNHSTRILKKNGFELEGMILDPEDGEVWEWKYRQGLKQV